MSTTGTVKHPGTPASIRELRHTLGPRFATRVEAWMAMLVDVSGRNSGVFCSVDIVDCTSTGVCIQWEYCFECSGYKRGSIHPRCLFCMYDFNSPKSKELIFNVEMPETGEALSFRGKVALTYWSEGKEMIGVVFTKIAPQALESLKALWD